MLRNTTRKAVNMNFSYKPSVELKDEFQESEEMKKTNVLKAGWIELDDFIMKYWKITDPKGKKHKRDYWIRRIKQFFDPSFHGKVGQAIVVHERSFCAFTRNIYRG